MRVGLMVGSDKERPRADRLAGLIEDGFITGQVLVVNGGGGDVTVITGGSR